MIIHNFKKVVKTEFDILGTVKLEKDDSAQDLLQYEHVKSIFSDKVSPRSRSAF